MPLNFAEKSQDTSPSPGPSTADTSEVSRTVEKKKKKKKKSKKKDVENKKEEMPENVLEFTGQENFYVDKSSAIGYLRVEKLYNPACPRYNISRGILGKPPRSQHGKYKRYFARKSKKSDQMPDKDGKYQLTEEEFIERNKEFNKVVREHPSNIDKWVEFVEFQSLTPMKSSTTKVSIAERKMGILDKALSLNPTNEKLYSVYVDTIVAVFPSFEVSKILEKLIARDAVSYTLWNAQILATQGSMARCVVPDVLALYDKCMSTMYKKHRNDATMLSEYCKRS